MPTSPATALGLLPQSLRAELIEEFRGITRNYRERRWKAAELDGGRLCEVVYCVLAGHVDNDSFPHSASKPKRFDEACKKLENGDPTRVSDSARLTIPRVLVGLYDLRNRRGVGHVGGDVDANEMDATIVLHTAQWIMAELVRLFHDLPVEEAAAVVHGLVDRTIPLLWEVDGVTRVMNTSLSIADKTLVRLYASDDSVPVRTLMRDLERTDASNYRRVLSKLHDGKKIEHNTIERKATISPLGKTEVEQRILVS